MAEGKAYMVLPAKLVIDGFLQSIIPSDDGRYIYAFLFASDDSLFKAMTAGNIPENPTVQHIVYDVKSGRKTVLAELPYLSSPSVQNWLPDGSGLYARLGEGDAAGGYILGLNGNIIKMPEMPAPRKMGNVIKVGGSFVVNSWVAGPSGYEDMKLHIYTADFASVRTFDLPEKTAPFVAPIPNQLAVYVRNDNGKFIGIDLVSGRLSEIQRPTSPTYVEPKFYISHNEKSPMLIGAQDWNSPLSPLSTLEERSKLGLPQSAPGDGFAVVTKEALTGGLLAGDRFVYHLHERGLFLSEIIEVDKALLEEHKNAAERTALLSKAKQVATGMMIYGADYDDQFPSIDDWTTKISPYVKNMEVMDGFVYMLGDKNLADIDDPANTVLGYIDCKDGRAVAYVDGHVKWEPRKTPPLLAEQKHIFGLLR
ncbi:MAG: hypothetical protein KDC26_06935 [Armatimonadetes bacterium]|nr:hypothetical protein [Armatimonadota bacterium]